jgi:hypothetical protein
MDKELYRVIINRTRDDVVRLALETTQAIQKQYHLTNEQANEVGLIISTMMAEAVKVSLDLCIELCKEEARS